MTLEDIYRAAASARKTGAAGVFSFDELTALGQTGDVQADWLRGGQAPGGLIAGGGRAALPPGAAGLPAGWYQVPGVDGAQWYDPASGQASQEFVDWVGSGKMERDPFTGVPGGYIAPEGGPEAQAAGRFDQSAAGIGAANDIIAGGRGPDGTYQESQDRVLGTGKYQRTMLDRNGKPVIAGNMWQASADAGDYKDVSSRAGSPWLSEVYDRLRQLKSMDSWEESTLEESRGLLAKISAETRDDVGALGRHNYEAYQELRAQRMARGEDADTGVSAAEGRKIYETYGRIDDEAQKAAYIRAQDPGNLTTGLKAARKAARAGEQDWMQKNQMAPEVTYESAVGFGDKSGGGVKTTYGDVMQEDVFGRETLFGHVPVKREYLAKQDNGLKLTIGGHDYLSAMDVRRINAGAQGLFAAVMTGGILGATVLGGVGTAFLAGTSGYLGAGGWLPNARNISFSNSRGWSQWKSGAPQELTATQFMIGLLGGRLIGSIASRAGAFYANYVHASKAIVAAGASASFASKFAMPTALSGLQLQAAAKGRQTAEDFMNRRRGG